MDSHDRPELLNALRETLNDYGGIRLAILFGSQASGRASRQSDLDLAVQMTTPLTAAVKMALIEKLAVVSGLPVDLIDLNRVGEPLLGQILKQGVRLVGSDEDYAALLSRHLFDAADFLPYRRRILAERRRTWIGK